MPKKVAKEVIIRLFRQSIYLKLCTTLIEKLSLETCYLLTPSYRKFCLYACVFCFIKNIQYKWMNTLVKYIML